MLVLENTPSNITLMSHKPQAQKSAPQPPKMPQKKERETLAICIPLHQRFDLIKELADQWTLLGYQIVESPKNNIKMVTICLTGAQAELDAYLDYTDLKAPLLVSLIQEIVPNKPLGAKFNATLALAKNYTYALLMGQDNLMNLAGFNALYNLQVHCAGFYGTLIKNQSTGKVVQFTSGAFNGQQLNLIGAGRLLHRTFLEAINYKIFSPTLNKGLDITLDQQILKGNYTWAGIDCSLNHNQPWLLDIKTPESLNAWHWFENCKPVEFCL